MQCLSIPVLLSVNLIVSSLGNWTLRIKIFVLGYFSYWRDSFLTWQREQVVYHSHLNQRNIVIYMPKSLQVKRDCASSAWHRLAQNQQCSPSWIYCSWISFQSVRSLRTIHPQGFYQKMPALTPIAFACHRQHLTQPGELS